MTREELLDRLQRYEWSDIEFKTARRDVPQNSYETVSAFANTAGGWLVFGVKEADGGLEVVGVADVDKVQNDFLSTLRAGKKLNRVITVKEEAHEVDGKTLLVFHVPESKRGEKPIYLGGDIRESFIRRGAGDERCTMREIERFLRDATTDHDSQTVDLDAEQFFDPDSLRWYRRVFDDRNPGRRQSPSDTEFLHEWGFVLERSGHLAPTRAAVLVLGRPRYVRQVLRRPVVDCQFINAKFDAWSPDQRWDARIVVEENLVQAWLTLSERFVQRAEVPFRIDPATLRRDDDPPDYISFRESAINLLLHQDYGDQHRHACIQLFRDRMTFWNPGEAFTTTDQLLEPRAKDVRNPDIVAAFRRLGLSEHAGTGIRAIFRNWQALGHVPPLIDNNKAEMAFEIRFLREPLLTETQQVLQSRLGIHLEDAEARVFAFACREGRVSVVDAKAVTGLMGAQAAAVLEALRVQGVLRPLKDGLYTLAQHLEGRTDLPRHGQSESDRVDMSTAHVSHRPAHMSTAHGHDQANMSTESADASAENDEPPTHVGHGDSATDQGGMSTAHVSHRPAHMSTAHGHDQANMSTESADASAENDEPPTETANEQACAGHGDLATGQADMSTAHVSNGPAGMSTAHGDASNQATPPTALSPTQRRIVAYCDVPRLLAEMMEQFGAVNRGYFKKRHLDPLIHDGLIAPTNPTKPRAPGQRYILTAAGVRLRAIHMNAEQ